MSAFVTIAAPACSITVGLLQTLSGYLMVTGVLAIRRFFQERNATNFINIKMLVRHAISFGLYLISTVADYGTFAIYIVWPNDQTFDAFMIA